MNRRTASLSLTTITAAVLFAFGLPAAPALASPSVSGLSEASEGRVALPSGVFRHLAGTWRLVGSPDPASGIPEFSNVLTITRDGKLVNVDPAVGTGVGETRRLSGRSYAVAFFGFLEMNGQVLEYEVQATVESNRERTEFSGPFRTLVRDLLGNLLFEYTGEVEAVALPEPAGF